MTRRALTRSPARRSTARTLRATAVGWIAAAALPAAGAAAGPAARFIGPTAHPYMGWSSYYGLGRFYGEPAITSVADTLIRQGLARAGYRIVWLDSGWSAGTRNRQGELLVNRRLWPHGMAWLTAWLHSRGLLGGIYTDAGRHGCRGRGVGSLGHYRQDADTFARWGFDAVKVDFCGAGEEGLAPRPLYRRFARAIAGNSSHRTMLLNVCNFWVPGQINGRRPSLANSVYSNYLWAPSIAQSWRTNTDLGWIGHIQFANVLDNLDADAAHPTVARAGHWNDPDDLGPGLGMTFNEAQAQLSMWAIVAAPLVLGSDPRRLSQAALAMLRNPAVIRIDQDPRSIQGRSISTHGDGQVWVKPLAGGAVAVALLNRGPTPQMIETSAQAAGLPSAANYRVQNVWSGSTTTRVGAIGALVPADAVVLYRVRAQ